jgi:energy-coupling factor transporter ATP-binding protein EcfA2
MGRRAMKLQLAKIFSFARARFRLEIDLEVSGQVIGIFGSSGAGKTSLLEVVAGLRKPDVGPHRRRRTGPDGLRRAVFSGPGTARRRLRPAGPRPLSASLRAEKSHSTDTSRRRCPRHQPGPMWPKFWKSNRCSTARSPIFPADKNSASPSRGPCSPRPGCS